MSEIIVLTRDQYADDIRRAAIAAAEKVLQHFTQTSTPATVTRAEFARLAGMSKATVKNKIDHGIITTTADGSRIPYSEVSRFLNQ